MNLLRSTGGGKWVGPLQNIGPRATSPHLDPPPDYQGRR
jgi:hypothetical protein